MERDPEAPFARRELPYRQHVAVADSAIVGEAEHGELDRIERIDAPRPPARALVAPCIVLALLLELLAHDGDQNEAVELPLEEAHADPLLHHRNEVVGVEFLIDRAVRQEALIALDVDGVAGAARIKLRRGVGGEPYARGVAERAADRHALAAGLSMREGDRHG